MTAHRYSIHSPDGQTYDNGRPDFANEEGLISFGTVFPQTGQYNFAPVLRTGYSLGDTTDGTVFNQIGGDPPAGGFSREVVIFGG